VTIEAMSQGLPVVASDVPVFREYLSHCVDALLPPAGNPDALAAALRAVLTDYGLRERLGSEGAATAARFTWEASATEHAKIYAAFGSRSGSTAG
jgi:glycosyltransferase involved in cell wall biosynthesis